MKRILGRMPNRITYVTVRNKKSKMLELIAVKDFTGKKE